MIGPRDFDYNLLYFLHIFSFEQPLEWRDLYRERVEIPDDGRGYRIDVGSTKSNEFFLAQDARLSWLLGGWLQTEFNYHEGEDFEARYRRVLVAGRLFVPWGFHGLVSSELHADKENIDVGLGAGWRSPERRIEAEIEWILADAMFNDKGSGGKYEEIPRTLRGLVRARPGAGNYAEVGVEIDLPLDFTVLGPGIGSPYSYRRRAFGTHGEWVSRFGGDRAVSLRWQTDNATERQAFSEEQDEAASNRTRRQAVEATLEGTLPMRAADRLETGLRAIYLYENLEWPQNHVRDERTLRREILGSIAYRWHAGDLIVENLFLRPALYLGYQNNRKLSAEDDEALRDRSEVGLAAKVGLGVEYRWGERLRIFLHPTLETTKYRAFAFGGGNVQAILAF